MYFLYEWASSIDPPDFFLTKRIEITRPSSMSRYHDERSLWNIFEIRLEYNSSFLKHTNDEIIMDDLMIDIYFLIWIGSDDLHEHIDSAMDSSTVATGICGKDGKRQRIKSLRIKFKIGFVLFIYDIFRLHFLDFILCLFMFPLSDFSSESLTRLYRIHPDSHIRVKDDGRSFLTPSLTETILEYDAFWVSIEVFIRAQSLLDE